MRVSALLAAGAAMACFIGHSNAFSVGGAPALSAQRANLALVSQRPLARSTCALGTRARRTQRAGIVMQQQPDLVGEDAAVFDLSQQSLKSWAQFVGVFVTVFAALFVLWVNPSTGYGDEFAQLFINLGGGDTSVAMVLMLAFFGIAHSGLAGLRAKAEVAINEILGTENVGERVWRVFFGVVSLPLAVSCVVFFINHRYDGAPLWDVKLVPGMHTFCWVMSFISFWFLYPSTFNLLEVAAVDKPKFHMWETGIMRITRHPQLIGQVIWCIPHTLWIGNSFMVATSAALCAHHLFGSWHGDRRLSTKYGEAFETVKSRTSTLPFAALLDGRQQPPEGWLKEFARAPYIAITVGTIVAYFAHPLMEGGATLLHW